MRRRVRSSNHLPFAGGLLAEFGEDARCDRTRLAGANLAGIHFDNRDDFGGGAGEEAFIGIPDIVPGDVRLNRRNLKGSGNLQGDLAGDAHEGAGMGGRSDEATFVNQEDVIASALGDIALLVEHEALVEAVLLGFHFCHDVIQVVERLDHRWQCSRADAASGGGDDLHARGVEFLGVQLDGIGDANNRRGGAILRREAEVAEAARDDEADVAVGEVIPAAGFADDFGDFLAGPWHI